MSGEAPGAAGPDPVATIETRRPFTLRPGGSARTADGSWQVGFDSVAQDSRCPKGVQCIWAGDAVARCWLSPAAGPRQVLELHTAPGRTQAVAAGPGQELRLVRLDPYPVGDQAIPPHAYVATLMLAPASPNSAER